MYSSCPYPSPAGECLFAHRFLPMGKKIKTLCALCGSVVNSSLVKSELHYSLNSSCSVGRITPPEGMIWTSGLELKVAAMEKA